MQYSFLLLIKPELLSSGCVQENIVSFVKDYLVKHHVSLLGINTFSGKWLGSASALNSLYCRLATISEVGEAALTASELAMAKQIVGVRRILPAKIAVREFNMTAALLCAAGDRAQVTKLGPGAYLSGLPEAGGFVLNHFFPEIESRFYAEDASVIGFECQATTPLHQLRDALVGHINPQIAQPGSLRRALFDMPDQFQMNEVSVAVNGFHISPGYLEAQLQLGLLFPERGTFLDRIAILLTISKEEMQHVANQPDAQRDISNIFHETENLDMDAAILRLRKVMDEF